MTVAESSVCCSYNLCSVLLVLLNLNRVLVLTKDGLLKSYAVKQMVKSNLSKRSIKNVSLKCRSQNANSLHVSKKKIANHIQCFLIH